jgi:hypothetical protein
VGLSILPFKSRSSWDIFPVLKKGAAFSPVINYLSDKKGNPRA